MAQAKSKMLEKEQLLQDIGIIGVLVFLFIQVALIVLLPEEASRMENLVMMLGVFALLVLAALKINYLAIILSVAQVIIFAVYKIYRATAYGEAIGWWSYLWIFLPALSVCSMIAFMEVNRRLSLTNEILREQVEELVVLDPLTGLPNLRSLYSDLGRQMSYSKRWGQPMTLMILQLRYAQELESILSKSHFRELRQRLAERLEEDLRLEDRIYAIDEHGSFAVILICDAEGAAFVSRRIQKNTEAPDAFSGIKDRPVKVEIKLGYLQYNADTMQNAMEFRQKVENELQYDV